jgi:hypothetical protein
MQPWRLATIVSLSLAFMLPGAIAAPAEEPLPAVTPFIDSAPVPPPSRQAAGGDAGQPPITPFIDSAPIPPHPATRPSRWYGGTILAADLGTLTCFVLAQNGVCLVPYLFAGAAVHGLHGRSGRAGLSIALRLLLPAIGGGMGGIIGGCPPSRQEPSRPSPTQTEDDMTYIGVPNIPDVQVPCDEIIVGALVGAAAAVALDAALAFTPAPEAVAPASTRGAVRLAPRLSFSQAHLTLGLTATF